MKIVVVGCGKVGKTIARQLAKENHDLTVIDSNKKAVERVLNELDVLGVCGNGATSAVLEEAGIASADLLIAATASDEINLLCCIIAKKLCVKNTIARVRNPEYSDQISLLREELGISLAVNPELAAANDIFRVLRFPAATKIHAFARGRVELVSLRLTEHNSMVGKTLIQLANLYPVKVLVCAVQRGDEVLIPGGSFVLQADDVITVTAPRGGIECFFKLAGVMKPQVSEVMIVGGGKMAYYLARRLKHAGIRSYIIEKDEARCRELCELLPESYILCGDGTDQDILREEGIENMSAFVSLTGIDEENVVLSMFAKRVGVGKIVTKVNHNELIDLLNDVGLDTVASPKDTTANRIVSYVRAMNNTRGSGVESMHSILDGRVEALEFSAREDSPAVGVSLRDLKIKPGFLVVSISRGQRAIIPGGDDKIEAGDRVVVVSTDEYINDLSDILA